MQIEQRGKVNLSLVMRLQDAFNGSPKVGIAITNLQIRYIRTQIDNTVTVSAWQSLVPLTGLTDPHTDNAGFEAGEGYYRIDVPDAVSASGAFKVKVLIQDNIGNSILVASRGIDLETVDAIAAASAALVPIAWRGI